jgi:hypothetical protein
MRSKILLATLAIVTPALLSAGLLDTTVTVGIPTMDDYFFYTECTATLSCTVNFGQINHGNPVPVVTDYPIPQAVPDSIVSGYVSVLGLDLTGADVVVGLASSVSIAGNPWPFATSEATIITDLQTANAANAAALLAFFSDPANVSDWVPYSVGTITTGNLGEFSTGVVVGSISTSLSPAVPEPGTLALLGCGLAALFFVRRKPEVRR